MLQAYQICCKHSMLQAKHQIRRKKQERTMMQQIEYAICE